MQSVCIKAYAQALEIIPYTLAENAGIDPLVLVTELKNSHIEGNKHAGINVRRACISNMFEKNVIQPQLVTYSALTLATECVRMILKIDEVVLVRWIEFKVLN